MNKVDKKLYKITGKKRIIGKKQIIGMKTNHRQENESIEE